MKRPELPAFLLLTAALLAASAITAVAAGDPGGPLPFLTGPLPEPRPTGRIAGRVIDEQGAPVPGASLRALLSRIAEGQQEAVLNLHFPPVHEVRGWVMDASGRPVPRAKVLFDRGLMNEREAATSSRADGSFTIRLEDGVYAVAVAWRSLREDPEMQRVEVHGAPVDRLELVVEVKD